MKQLTMMNDIELERHIEQLKRDGRDFGARAAHAASTAGYEGRDPGSDPLYQRLASIRDFLHEKLEAAEHDRERRAKERARRPQVSLGGALLELCLPWRRARATR